MFFRAVLVMISLILAIPRVVAESIPAKLQPPQGTVLIGSYAAKGTQIYVCAAKDGANEWALKGPEAELRDAQGQIFAKHYVGPSWEAMDGSKIVGKVLASEPAPTADAIAWLLLSVQPSGNGVLSVARFVQRVNTVGGVGPSGVCAAPGAEQRAPYTADYLIYK
jgi:hypothetical protein